MCDFFVLLQRTLHQRSNLNVFSQSIIKKRSREKKGDDFTEGLRAGSWNRIQCNFRKVPPVLCVCMYYLKDKPLLVLRQPIKSSQHPLLLVHTVVVLFLALCGYLLLGGFEERDHRSQFPLDYFFRTCWHPKSLPRVFVNGVYYLKWLP